MALRKQGEELACRKLRHLGYAILARRYRNRHGENDIVAMDGKALVLVEVKTRSSDRFGTPLAAVTPDKQRWLTRMALDYLAHSHTTGVPCCFEVMSAVTGNRRPVVEVVSNAFRAATR